MGQCIGEEEGSVFATTSLCHGTVCLDKETEETTGFDSGSFETWRRKLVFELRAGQWMPE